MRIVFMGSPDFALPSLRKIAASDHDIAAVVSNVDKRRGRREEPSPTPVKKEAQDMGLPVITVENLDDPGFANRLKELQPDLFVVVAFRILPRHLLEIPSRGSVNLHASLLPRYRGAAPIHWAIMKGEKETGVSVFFLDEKVDTGAIIRQEKTPIGPNETTGDLYERLKNMGSEVLLEAIQDIEDGSYTLTEQDHEKATPAPKLYTEDCRVDFDRPAEEVHNKIRGLSPFPTAWAELDDLRFNMYRSKIGKADDLGPGELAMKEEGLAVGTATRNLILEEVQIEGKRRMSGEDFMNGYSGTGWVH